MKKKNKNLGKKINQMKNSFNTEIQNLNNDLNRIRQNVLFSVLGNTGLDLAKWKTVGFNTEIQNLNNDLNRIRQNVLFSVLGNTGLTLTLNLKREIKVRT
ncbi:hypothetical protein BpHYR1_008517 [Brachionus plicatilis]|uniref:Uncharacterized protein n=1 Tax=Brachionus plicatilis TaxID=10195 RepID=A0A3M7T4N8_BRAPC|nr:hypothetical protein BpHYR1_008517 [Brachionus plicatilis]